MPEIPAPATSTSKCSLVIGRNSSPRTLHTPTRWADHPPAVGEAESTGQEAGTADRLAIPFLRPQRDLGGEGECGWNRKSARLNSSHTVTPYADFCLKQNRARFGPRGADQPGRRHPRGQAADDD